MHWRAPIAACGVSVVNPALECIQGQGMDNKYKCDVGLKSGTSTPIYLITGRKEATRSGHEAQA